ncbi:hypothetical protein EHQ27_01870 [Leptospira wolffii]|uniref:LIC11274 family protein n=1 Tax=Leptospira wolffii TaxID=409998 RepID=UPI00034D0794|nr:hypothetical protein [Leptospira wolffii]TGK56088.1 hypothetical protein EHQ32_16890 [Leptospira wolffii]TGK72134.1 hypothetical protein EHQ35_12325 [Leptospira wolffii]TGK77438.1 hypothetical protein EHQ27_01870 [Leptospira wolffii]TGL27711.1 hypothetical protein EHQ57_15150 [Leptospira wolffii]
MKKLIVFMIAMLVAPALLHGEAVSMKSYKKRIELLTYLRAIEPIVKNYPGEAKQAAGGQNQQNQAQAEGDRLVKYKELKRLYQEGLLYFFEGNHVNSYRRFLEAQLGMELLLEELSQSYVERTEEILKTAIEKKNPNNPTDRALVDISVEYGKNSYIRADIKENREAPFTRRMYNPREFHYVVNKYTIEKNMELGYQFLGEAKDARNNALKIEKHLEKHQKLQPEHRKHRIEMYLGAIGLCRDARANAMNIFKLKYPYDNYYLQRSDAKTEELKNELGDTTPAEVVSIEGVTYDFSTNPLVRADARMSPVFDKRIPDDYRRDAVDILGRVYDDEVDNKLYLRWDAETRKKLLGDKKPPGSKKSQTPAK